MIIKVKTEKLEFEFDDEKIFTMGNYFEKDNKPVLEFIKECIQKVVDESNKMINC
jgi:hypothetical protein